MENIRQDMNEVVEQMERNPLMKVAFAIGDLEGTVSNLGDAVCMMNQLIEPIANEVNGKDYYISLTKSQAKALYGILTYMENIHSELEGEVIDLYDAANKAKVK